MPYDEDYFLRGQELGISGYTDYRWMPDLTLPMARAIVDHLRVRYEDTILDFGCARGYVVKALRQLGYRAFGYDASEWAIRNCDDEVRAYVNFAANSPPFLAQEFDWILAKDVLEHVPDPARTVDGMMGWARRGVFAVVPLAAVDGFQYVVPDYERDVTHVHRCTLSTWARAFVRPGWSVEMGYRLRGVKDNYAQYATGNGFITARRLE